MESRGSSCRPDVVKEPENPKEVESVAKKVVDKIETVKKTTKESRMKNFRSISAEGGWYYVVY